MHMHKQQKFLLAIILIGGVAVLDSYAWGILAIQNATQILWGDVPAIIRSFSTVGMFTGALGFFAYSFYILFKLKPDDTRIYSRFGYTIFNYLYLANGKSYFSKIQRFSFCRQYEYLSHFSCKTWRTDWFAKTRKQKSN